MQVVVGAALVRDGRVLGARRRSGGWEFPGGKVEPGETEAQALVRECQEELGVEVAVGAAIGAEPISTDLVLRVYLATLVSGEPVALLDHDELRWLAPDEFDDVPWLPADVPLVAALRPLLG